MVMKTRDTLRRPLRFASRAAVLALSGFTVLPSLAAAQGDFVGLSSLRSSLFVERTQEGFFPGAFDNFGAAFVAADFSGDGRAELVTGIPGDDCSASVSGCGAVFLSWGHPIGLFDQGGFLWAGAEGSPATANQDDRYGHALAAGDFNADGLGDLVIGAPGGNFFARTGNAQIHYGLPGHIQTVPEHLLEPGLGGVPDDGMDDFFRNAEFGAAFATGDFNGDGHGDLAIGSPSWTFGRTEDELLSDAGVVVVAHGHIGGLVPFEGFLVSQEEPAIPDAAEDFDLFGAALVAGDFNGDGFDDLVIGVPGEDGSGAILVLFGSPHSLLFAAHYWLGEFDLGGSPALGDQFGTALAAADWNGDGFDDLAIGAWGDNGPDGLINNMGLTAVLYGAPGVPAEGGGFNFAARQWWRESLVGATDTEHDAFGRALAAGDFDGDGFHDLAIGTPNDGQDDGAVYVLAGGPTLLGARTSRFRAGHEGIPGPPPGEHSFHFGRSLAAGDFDGNGFDDLAVGAPYQSVGGLEDAGAEVILYGSLFSDGFEGGSFRWSSVVD
jgi:hypothetical protein